MKAEPNDPLLAMQPFDFSSGRVPLLISMPHVGSHVPARLAGRLSQACGPLGDTDWHLVRLYDFVAAMGASVLAARYTRFTVDLNRPPDDAPLYATATTGLHPDILFDGQPAFNEGGALDAAEKAAFLEGIWRPYHAQLAAELARLKNLHGYALLLDAHSIAGEIPRLFEGLLPDFNIGTADGASAGAGLAEGLGHVVERSGRYRLAVNGRFKGGYITRHYGRPAERIHAVQLELAQRTYMRESVPYDYDEARADAVRPVLREFVVAILQWGRDEAARSTPG